jgi:hypothetical protein
MTVIDFSKYKPHLSGEIKCVICGHIWIGVCPVDPEGNVPCLECPECGLRQGFFHYPILPKEGDEIYKCNCGGELFYIETNGSRCIRCGILHDVTEAT